MAVLDITAILRTVGADIDFSEKVKMEPMVLMGDNVLFENPVTVSGNIINNGSAFLMRAFVSGEYTSVCSRCGDDVKKKIEFDFESVMYHNPVRSKHAPSEKESADLIYKAEKEEAIIFTSHLIELEPIISNEIFSRLPMRLLCSEDCKGLCPVCGANLNRESCNCLK